MDEELLDEARANGGRLTVTTFHWRQPVEGGRERLRAALDLVGRGELRLVGIDGDRYSPIDDVVTTFALAG